MKISHLPAAVLLLTGMLIGSPQSFAQDLILTAPPREKPADGQKQYGPLAAYLTTLFGKKVTYVFPGNWLTYQRDMREDKYDIIFDGAHFISWRMLHLGNEVVVKLPGTLQFYLLAKKDNDKIKSINDLVGQKVCAVPPPNLASLSVLAKFDNPVRQPVIKGIRGAAAAVLNAFNKGECVAAVLRTDYYNKVLTDTQRTDLKIIYTSQPFPNQGISVSKRVTKRERDLMQQALTAGPGVKVTLPIVKRFGGKANSTIAARHDEFVGFNNLLEGVIFGWD